MSGPERPEAPRKATFFVRDLSGNPIIRAAPLAAALQPAMQVQIVGRLPPGREVYAPYRGALHIEAIAGSARDPRVLLRLARLATGEVLIACKPLPETLIPALVAQRLDAARTLIIDVEDDEWSEMVAEPAPGLRRRLARSLSTHAVSARLLHPLTRCADGIIVATRALQRRYGGELIRHGPDESVFDPALRDRLDRSALRARLGLPEARRLALFAGVPRPHKGWDTLLAALEHPDASEWDLVAAGTYGASHHASARARLGARFHLLPFVARVDMPELLSAVDAVPVPQHDVPFARAQLPAKLLDALAMRVPVVASRVGDLPEILGNGERGWLFAAGDAAALANALAHIAREQAEADRRTARGREWFLAEASTTANRPRLEAIVHEAVAVRQRRAGAAR